MSSEDLSDSGPTRISFFILEMYSSLEESIDTAIIVSGNSFQIPGLLTSLLNQSESVSPSGNMNNSQKKGVTFEAETSTKFLPQKEAMNALQIRVFSFLH